MLVIACPDWVRRAQAWYELPSFENISGTLRMPALPSAWHDWHAFLTVSTQWSCVFMLAEMPLPFSPVPGNSLLSGILSSEYQYMPGYSSAASFSLGAGLAFRLTLFPGTASVFFEFTSPEA